MQELRSMEEKMDYQLEEKTRDMKEELDRCNTKVDMAAVILYITLRDK